MNADPQVGNDTDNDTDKKSNSTDSLNIIKIANDTEKGFDTENDTDDTEKLTQNVH
jgi:hypothetical protein